MSFRGLPIEMLFNVAGYLTSVADIFSLSILTRRSYAALKFYLYEYDAKSLQPRALLWAAAYGNQKMLENALGARTDVDTQFTASFPFKKGNDKHAAVLQVVEPGDSHVHPPRWLATALAAAPAESYTIQGGLAAASVGHTAILAAARAGHAAIVERLLAAGANPRGMDGTGRNALHCAAAGDHIEIIKLLLEKSPSLLYDYDHDGEYNRVQRLPLEYGAKEKSVFRLLLEAMDPLMYSLGLLLAASYGYDDIFDWLKERAPIRITSIRLLLRACQGNTEGHLRLTRSLLEDGGKARLDAVYSCKLLYIICMKNRSRAAEFVKLLLEHGADATDHFEENGGLRTPLIGAGRHSNIEIMNLLLESVERPIEVYNEALVPLIRQSICWSQKSEGFRLIRDKFPFTIPGMEATAMLLHASWHNNYKLAEVLIKLGVDVNASHPTVNPSGALHPSEMPSGALQSAWSRGSVETIKLLLAAGADPNAVDHQGFPILTHENWPLGSEKRQLQCLKLLLDAGADPLAVSKSSHTALHSACLAGAVECVRLLLHHYNADATMAAGDKLYTNLPDTEKSDGLTPLHAAVRSGKLEIVKMLVARGASVHDTYARGCTALHDACVLEKPEEIIEFLLSKGVQVSECFWYGKEPMRYGCTRHWIQSRVLTPLEILIQQRQVPPSRHAVELLLDCSDQNQKTMNTMLIKACERKCFEAARVFLEQKTALKLLWGSTEAYLLFRAAYNRDLNMVMLLIEHGADVNLRTDMGLSPLAIGGPAHAGIIKCLLSAGADIGCACVNRMRYKRDEKELPQSVRHESAKKLAMGTLSLTHDMRALELLLDKLDKVLGPEDWRDVLFEAVKNRAINLIRLLVERGLATIDQRNSTDDTTAGEALIKGSKWPDDDDSLAIVRYLRGQERARQMSPTRKKGPNE
ncbi:ankyrin 2,3 unc44 [Cordyceps militaris]|uniref:Ankyrin 2,3 unc44 n=1 Tax=Cordyceps militaris TaxID=73501 RepID=A0A2H4SA92_CORMI|nr:ankyrin 2,3 unc44 [Cordyceps militaris]